jgi:hypothetical protein
MRSVAAVAVLVAGAVTTGAAGAVPGFESALATAAAAKSCTPAQIAVSHGAPQGTAGTTFIPIIFKDTGATCTIFGVPSVQAVSGKAHHPVGPPARNQSMGEMPAIHTIAKGQAVSDAFGVVDTGNYTASTCGARSANGVIVTLGDFVHSRYVKMPITVCTKRSSTTTRLITPGTSGN